jgi:5-(carboxyamino)imidazole ribonucleotide synthase
MLALAAARLGLKCHIYCPDPESPAFDVAAARTVAAYEDGVSLDAFARSVDVVTYEFENVDVAAAERLGSIVPVRPGPRALAVAQDRVTEKRFLRDLGIETAPFFPVSDLGSLEAAVGAIGRPAVLKTRRFGYDGKGQTKIGVKTDLGEALHAIGNAPGILEGFVPFSREISVIAARGTAGEVASYDPAENVHHGRHPAHLEGAGRRLRRDRIGGGAYRPNNPGSARLYRRPRRRVLRSRRWRPGAAHGQRDRAAGAQFRSLDGGRLRRFAVRKHVRAIVGWPLGPTTRHAGVAMTNLIGADAEDWRRLAGEPGARLHLYGKHEARPGRKIGHVNRLSP